MNEAANTSTYQEYVWRRLSEPLTLFGHDFPAELWWFILVPILVAAFAYVGLMYVKDSRGVGFGWASFLGVLRVCVYLLLAFVFMLRAKQSWEETRVMGKVLVVFDVSPSLTKVVDDASTGRAGEKLQTRQDKVLAFLTDADKKFLANLEAKNPVTAFRFASRLDDNYLLFKDGRNWTRAEWEEFTRNADRDAALPEAKPLPVELLQAWLNPGTKVETPIEWATADKERLEKMQELTQKLGEAGIFSGTNLGSAGLSLVNRELNGRVQGIVFVTDGRSTEGSPRMFEDIEARAKAAHIPLFVVGIGEERPQVKIDVVDVRLPEQVQPEDKFRAVVELQGEGLPEKPTKVFLDVTYTRKDKNGKDEDLDLTLTEQVNKNAPEEKRTQLSLRTKKLTLEPAAPVQFDRSSPPRVTVEFSLDAQALAKAAHIDLESKEVAGKKWELTETGDGELRFRVRVPRDPQEAFAAPFHTSEPSVLRVVKKPLRVLVFSSAATRDYQFLRSILVRETDKKRAEVSIYLQLPPGVTERRGGIVQDVPPERLLGSFPTSLESNDKEDKMYALDQYDVIVAFDPDWTQLSAAQLKMVEKWVEKGGGLIAVAGAINTGELARPTKASTDREKLKPILDLYPVVLSDVRLLDMDRSSTEAWPLNFSGATPDMEFLKLDESEDATKFLSDWDAFFYGRDNEGDKTTAIRGFYSYYPVEKAKTTSVVVARFTDPRGKLKDGSQQPYIVLTSPSSNRRVVWLGSGEIWRLRSFSIPYHERFWMKLLRYAASNNMSRVSKRIRLYMGSNHVANKPIEFEGKFDGKDGETLAPNAKPPVVTLTPPPGTADAVAPKPFEMTAKASGEGWFSGRFQVRAAGDYTLQVKVPETGDTLSQRFSVKEANPEMDNTRPDFQTLYQLASEADDVLGRMSDAERQNLRHSLQRPKLDAAKTETKDDKLRLYFTLGNAHLIPTCMKPDVQTLRSRGPIQDVWDEGFVVWDREPPYQPIKMSWILLAVVGLLSLEWLTRKLLRLA